jgi:hypothetical protein
MSTPKFRIKPDGCLEIVTGDRFEIICMDSGNTVGGNVTHEEPVRKQGILFARKGKPGARGEYQAPDDFLLIPSSGEIEIPKRIRFQANQKAKEHGYFRFTQLLTRKGQTEYEFHELTSCKAHYSNPNTGETSFTRQIPGWWSNYTRVPTECTILIPEDEYLVINALNLLTK